MNVLSHTMVYARPVQLYILRQIFNSPATLLPTSKLNCIESEIKK